MKKTQEIPWKRISAEGFAIVVSILLAFGIDAWWDERRERAEEQVLLTRLAAEFSINLERIELYIEGFSNIVDACSQLYEIVDNAMVNQEETAGLPAGWLRLSLIAPLYEANTPLLDALTKGGKLDVVDDSRVIEAVSEWERQLRDYTSMAERARRGVDSLLKPALYKRGDIGSLLVGPWITEENGADPMWRIPVIIEVDREIKGIVAGRYEMALDTHRDFEQLRDAAAEVIASIEGNVSEH